MTTLTALMTVLADEGLLPPGLDPAVPLAAITLPLVEALHRLLARTPAALFAVRLEDLLGMTEQANLPGTVDEHPNWRRKLEKSLDEIASDAQVRQLAAAIAIERGAPKPKKVDP